MFERYTEKARRVIFFARYEASQYGSPYIETEHLLLGLLREDKGLLRLLPAGAHESIRNQVDASAPTRKGFNTSVDLPLSNESKRVLAYAAEEAERLAHHHIGTEHLLLALFREKRFLAAELLRQRGLVLEKLRVEIAKQPVPPTLPLRSSSDRGVRPRDPIEIHDALWDADYIHDAVVELRKNPWHWNKQEWKPRDIVINRDDKHVSFDLGLAQGPTSFDLVEGGWKKDLCAICSWELMESTDLSHSTGYTNGRDWLCCECYEKFFTKPGFFSSTYSEIT